MTEISWVAIFGMTATTFTVIVATVVSPSERHSSQYVDIKYEFLNVKTIAQAFSTFCFAFSGHNIFPSVEETMLYPRSFNKMLFISFIAIITIYIPPTITGYWAFGQYTLSPILLNLGNGIASQMAIIAITMHLLVTIPIINNPVNLYLETDLFKIQNRKYEFLFRAIIRITLLGIQTLFAVELPDFGGVMNAIGSTCVPATVFFFYHVHFI